MSGLQNIDQIKILIGDTILVYQGIENLMKSVARHVDVSVPIVLDSSVDHAKTEKIIEKRTRHINSSTMGGAAKEYLKVFEPLTFSEADGAAFESSFRMKMEISTNEADRKAWAKEVEQLVVERNWVVHQSLAGLCGSTGTPRNDTFERLKACNAHAQTVLQLVERQAETTRIMRQVMSEKLIEGVITVMVPSLCISVVANNKKAMRPDKEGWIPLQRLLARCEIVLGETLNEACGLTQTKKLEFLRQQMVGVEVKEQKTKKGVRMMFRIPETAAPVKEETRCSKGE